MGIDQSLKLWRQTEQRKKGDRGGGRENLGVATNLVSLREERERGKCANRKKAHMTRGKLSLAVFGFTVVK